MDDRCRVMMGWEEPLMKEHVRLMCESKGEDEEGPTVLNVGFGLGIVSSHLNA